MKFKFFHTPKDDGGWRQWFIYEMKTVPSAMINFFTIVGILLIIFWPSIVMYMRGY